MNSNINRNFAGKAKIRSEELPKIQPPVEPPIQPEIKPHIEPHYHPYVPEKMVSPDFYDIPPMHMPHHEDFMYHKYPMGPADHMHPMYPMGCGCHEYPSHYAGFGKAYHHGYPMPPYHAGIHEPGHHHMIGGMPMHPTPYHAPRFEDAAMDPAAYQAPMFRGAAMETEAYQPPMFAEQLKSRLGKKVTVKTLTDKLEGILTDVHFDHLILKTEKKYMHILSPNIVYVE